MNRSEFKDALSVTTPTLIAYFCLGIVFGVLFTHANFSWYLAPLMSALAYAGAVQFVALSMMMEHSSVLAILLATVFIALRNSFYGLTVIERFKPAHPLLRAFLIYGLVDSTYAIFSIKEKQTNDIRFCFYVTLLPYLSWVGGTFFGALFADVVPELQGLDFVLTSFFALLVIEYYLINKKIDALIVPIVASFASYWLIPQYYLLLAIISCASYLYIKIRVTP